MKKVIIYIVALAVLIGGLLLFANFMTKKANQELLEETIATLHSGEYELAEDGFHKLLSIPYPDSKTANTLYDYTCALQAWNNDDIYTKLWAYDYIEYCRLGVNYEGVLSEEILTFVDEVKSAVPSLEAQRQKELEEEIANGKPYVGMDAKYISRTCLGPYDKTGYNYKNEFKDGRNIEHRCTLYYWMDGRSCIFIARVQDDIGEVINVEDHPKGSYFGNG